MDEEEIVIATIYITFYPSYPVSHMLYKTKYYYFYCMNLDSLQKIVDRKWDSYN